MKKMTVKDVNVFNKRVLVRVDFNVPLNEVQEITDDTRIRAAIPTINYLIAHGAKIILCSHLGRPKGKFNAEMSLAPVAKRLAELLPGIKVTFAHDLGMDAEIKSRALGNGEVLLLENLRFHPEEESNNDNFAKELASLADIYVSDAFGTVHRAHASTAGITKHLPAVTGFLIEKELKIMGAALENPIHPFVAILGGAKVKDKIGVIKNLLNICDTLLIGGGMSYTFFKAMGYEIGASLLDAENEGLALDLIEEAKLKGVKLILPLDTVVAKEFKADASYSTVPSNSIPSDSMGLDIGEKTREIFTREILNAKTVIWNGPMGVFEFPAFAVGTEAVAKACADCSGVTIIGGGDSAAAVTQLGYADSMTHISTGGGASLEFLEGKTLPGVAALSDKTFRRPIIVGNWKMNMTPCEAKTLIGELLPLVKTETAEVVIAPPFIDIPLAHDLIKGTNLSLAAQNIHFAKSGAYTGEISADMLKAYDVEYVIIGHSERRQYFAETDETVNRRARAALMSGITPIICVGETLLERESNKTEVRVKSQVEGALIGFDHTEVESLVIAYEPIWAIGTGKTATEDEAEEVIAMIRSVVENSFGADAAKNIRILYGGSMNAKNAEALIMKPDIDGGLIGGASLKTKDFSIILNAASKKINA
ncbi:MAG: triose-phosphate isomerase [Clostridia bacterium]